MHGPDEATARNADRRRLFARLAMCLFLFSIPLALLAIQGWRQRWIGDDGMINIRIVHMILEGHGPVFNIGERVEAHTSALWVYLIAAWSALGARPEVAAMFGGWLLTLGGLVAGMFASFELEPRRATAKIREGAWCFPLGALIYASLPPAWDYTTSGLEMGLTLAWLGGTYWLATRWRNAEDASRAARRLWRITLLASSLGPLVRPDMAIPSILMGAIMLAGTRRTFGTFAWRRALECAAMLGAIPVGYQLFRMGYYGVLTPNTAIAKDAFGARWVQGHRFFDNTFGRYHLLAPMMLALLFAGERTLNAYRKRDLFRVALLSLPVVCGLFFLFYTVRIGGGFMHGRLLLPAIACLLLPVFTVCVKDAGAPVRSNWRFGAVILVALWSICCVNFFRVERENEHGIGDERGWYARMSTLPNPVLVSDYEAFSFYRDAADLREVANKYCPSEQLTAGTCAGPAVVYFDRPRKYGPAPGVPKESEVIPGSAADGVGFVVMRSAIGISGVVLGPGVHLVDHIGLADPIASHLVLVKRGRPGHEKQMRNVWVAARFAKPREGEDEKIGHAREALACPQVRELLEAVTAPMTRERFVKNVMSAPSLHRLRIHPDPQKARQCETAPR
jgi:arabinofuranosyltransferase